MNIYKKLLVPLFCFVFILMSSCSPDQPEKPTRPIESVEYDMNDLDPSLRLVLMMGHVAAGMELYRSGEYEMAAPHLLHPCLLYTSPSPRDRTRSRMPSSA